MHTLPPIGITMGDPAGIGPEVIVKTLAGGEIHRICRPVVLGDLRVLKEEIARLRSPLAVRPISRPAEASGFSDTIDLLPFSEIQGKVIPGSPTMDGGRAMVTYVIEAVNLARKGDLKAIVTCPINKSLMHDAGYPFEGHTQLISELTHTPDPVMMLAGERLRVSLATIHCPLREVPSRLSVDRIVRTILVTGKALKEDFGLVDPRLSVAALNPHGGESGLFGSEEIEIIAPAVRKAGGEGFRVEGPLPADTLFYRAASGEFDAVVAMYHDQGLIPLKLLHFSDAVNVTLGLPLIRTSVDHGTAYDIAGKGKADPASLQAAIALAAEMIQNRARRA
jgi:4-phospho-D-threonate 3-dehydrogenase / 4-phospho-D-erythronate 3-dehydrogenase